MAKRTPKRQKAQITDPTGIPKLWSDTLGVALLAIGALVLGGLVSHQYGDGTLMGPVGSLTAGALYAGFGMASYLFVLGIFGIGFKAMRGQQMELRIGEGVGFMVATLAGCVLLHVSFPHYRVEAYTSGGLTGELLGEVSLGLFSKVGTYLIGTTVLCLGLVASTPLSTRHLVVAGAWTSNAAVECAKYLWSGAIGIVDAQREQARAHREKRANLAADQALSGDWDEEEEDWDEDGDDDESEEVAEGDDEYEYEYEYEYEDDDEETAEASSNDTETPKQKPRKRSGVKKANNSESTDDSSEAAATDEPAATPGRKSNRKIAAKGESRKKNGTKTAAEEETPAVDAPLPEIVVPDESDAGTTHNEKAEAQAAGALSDGERGKSATASNGKKAPPRPGELARQPKAKPETPKSSSGTGRVEYLTTEYVLPELAMFAVPVTNKVNLDRDAVYRQADRIVHTLNQFRIKGQVTKVHPGPVITRYEFKPEAGVKLSKIETLENDLAMALEAIRIRILAPIPGKASVGFEVPNRDRETVGIQEILSEENMRSAHKGQLRLGLGKDITGKPCSLDLATAPHLLVAGATGSGKSVGVNSMICSLLYSCTPDDVRMILIDPKMLEFSVYADIPHLLLPVITDAEKANNALRWTVNEMERRYALLSEARVRDLKGYNTKLPVLQEHWESEKKMLEHEAQIQAGIIAQDGEASANGAKLSGIGFDSEGNPTEITGGAELSPRPEKLPYIVVVIDEFADLMMVASKEVETSVARIAAKARAAGIHLIVATQRPSVDVITGTIKNNFPSRIAFQVTSDIDSRTILDQKGARQLLGMGDMLYMDRGREPKRIHGCFVSENEIEKVVAHCKKQARPAFDLKITEEAAADSLDGADAKPADPLYDKAVQLVAEAQKVSTSMIQRRLGIGYNRAATIVERMEDDQVIGPSRGTKPREVFISAA